ncbi:MAG: response regulator [Chitinispirillaceae bacterium]
MKNKKRNRILHPASFVLVLFLLYTSLIITSGLSTDQKHVMVGGTAILCAVLIVFVEKWIRTPLRKISQAIKSGSTESILSLCGEKNELGTVAEQIRLLVEKKKDLHKRVSDQSKTEEVLIKNEDLYRNLVETSPDAIVVFNPNGRILICNDTAASLVGLKDSGELLKRNCFRFIHPGEKRRINRYLENAQEKGRIRDLECLLQREGQKSFPAELSLSIIYSRDGSPKNYLALCRDISCRKQNEFEKVHLEEQFRNLHKMEAIGQLAGGIAHDFNNILGAISGYAELIKHKYSSDPRLEKYSTMILSAAMRASDLTTKLLTFSRRGKLESTPFSSHSVLSDITDLLERTIDKRINIKRVFKAKKPLVCGDPAQFQTSIMNIALNARDAMPEGGELLIKTEDTEVDEDFSKEKAYALSPGAYIKITLEDNGTGMDQHTLSKIFEPFFTTKDLGKGTGLGLASVYGSIKSHKGYIEADSVVGKGSVFTIYLPVIAETEHVLHTSQQQTAIKGKGTIMIVDDEAFLCNALKEMLSWIGYSAITFNDGAEGVKFYSNNSHSVDLVILDLMMPGISGKDCIKLLREINDQVKIIISSGYALEEERQKLLSEGVIDILQKPFMAAQLSSVIHNALKAERRMSGRI